MSNNEIESSAANIAAESDIADDGISTVQAVLAIGIFILMIGVGAMCERQLFRKIIQSPKAFKAATVGLCCQFGIMPLLCYLLTLIFNVKGYSALGFILVGCMPGGSSSNVYTMWSQGILELSVFMTLVSTIASFGLTPLWLYAYGKAIGLESALAMDQIAISFALLVVPLIIGAAINCCLPNSRKMVQKLLSIFSIFVFLAAIVLIGLEYPDALKSADYRIFVPAVFCFPISGAISYFITSALKFEPALKRTIVIEVGLQNLALGFAIGELTVKKESQRNETVPFPLIYAMFMYFWALLLVPLFRYQHQSNEAAGIRDNDPDFFLKEEEIEESDGEASRQEKGTDDTSV